VPVLIALLMNLLIGPLAPVLNTDSSNALAALEVINDEQGANDEPGQKDLTQLGIDYAGLPNSVFVQFNLDDTAWSGNNSGDGCTLFDTDDDLNVNFSLCATVKGSPAAIVSTTLYACTADAKVDRCTGPSLLMSWDADDEGPCDAAILGTDPFPTGDFHPNDAVITCTIDLSLVGATSAELVNVCSYPSQEPNSDPSDCVLIIRDGALRVTKVVTNDNGGTLKCEAFSFTVQPGAISENFEADPDCSNLIAVEPGTYSVTEPTVSGYATSYSNCTNVAVASGEIETCTITNNDQGATLTVTKIVVNDNGGTAVVADFPLFIDANATTSGSPVSVNAGVHTVSETGDADYSATIGGDCAANGTVTIALGQSKSCTITNNDKAPGLTLVKSVTNDNGGSSAASAFTLTASGPTGFSGAGPSVSNGASFDAGTYNLSESGPDGYTGSAWVCVGGTQDDDDTVTLALGESATCTITNDDDEPTLTLIKEVKNDDGGDATAADWTLSATGTGGAPTNLSGTSPVTSGAGFEADTYTLAENDGPSGYTAGTWDCGSATMPTSTTVTVGLGEDVTCTIVNDDEAATLIVTKEIVGGDLGCEDFMFGLNDSPTPSAFESDCSNELTVDAGDYTVSEPNFDGYTTTYENSLNDNEDCDDLHLGNGETATCTITNTRDTGDLEIVKVLDPSDDPGLFDLLVDNAVEASDVSHNEGTGPMTLETGTFEVSEEAGTGTSLSDYDSSIECIDAADGDKVVATSDGTALFVDVTKGSDITCTITNAAIDVGIGKTYDDEDGRVEPGDIVEFELTVSINTGTATHVVVTDTLPEGLSYLPYGDDDQDVTNIPPTTIDGQTLTWDLGTLDDDLVITYLASVDADAEGSLENMACLDADQNPAQICTATELLVQDVDIAKTNSTTGAVIPGTSVDFALEFDVANGPVGSLTIVDQLPAGISVVDESTISDGGHYDAATNSITWTLSDVADGKLLTYDAVVSATATAGAYTNVATITEGPCQGDDCESDSTVTVRVPGLVVDKAASTETITISGPNSALVATPSVVTWTLSYTLTSGPVTNAVITDAIPTGFTFLDAANGGTFAGGTVTWNLGTLSASGSVSFRTTVDPTTISRVAPTVNTAIIDSSETGPDQGQDSVTVSVIPPPLAGNPTPKPSLPNTAIGFGSDGTPLTVPIELLAVFFIGSLGALALANAKARSRRQ
jgi:fimbrial isopeptide formation D2 family protein